VCALAAAAPVGADELVPVPPGVQPPPIPADNPVTQEKVDLGRKLFFDKRLSKDDSISCGSCHEPTRGWVDPRPAKTSAGFQGFVLPRNSPTILNVAFKTEEFWDGRLPTLEAQVQGALTGPPEMGFGDVDGAPAKLKTLPEYAPLFRSAFGDETISMDRVAKAIASFERTLVTLNAPIDRFLAGDATAFSDSAKRGWALFNSKASCNQCHSFSSASPLFSDAKYHNIGVGVTRSDFAQLARSALKDPGVLETSKSPTKAELGRFAVTRKETDLGAFRTPPLRNAALTAPYMHDGSVATLRDVIEFYDRGGNQSPWLDRSIRKLGLTEQEKQDLVALLESFTSEDLARFDKLGTQAP
jgi:cytochrome c peroxidase